VSGETSDRVLHEPDEVLLAFTRALRAAGVGVTHDRAAGFLEATAAVGLDGPGGSRPTYLAGRATLCASPDELARYDQVFEAFFDARTGLPRERPVAARPTPSDLMTSEDQAQPDDEGTGDKVEAVRAAASDVEVLRALDVAAMSSAEKQRLTALLARLRVQPPLRRTARHRSWHRSEVDARATIRQTLRRLGEPGEVRYRRRVLTPRRVVLLVDVSGSMSGYADVLLRLAHRMTHAAGPRGARPRVETFTVGTRVTHLTRAMANRDPERALVAAGEAVPDWSGGTRLGEGLAFFLDRWGRRGMARGSVVVVFSDGWERGDASLLGEQAARLSRLAHRVVWVNPHRGKDGYEAVQQGVLAVLPHVDDFVAGHTLATYEELVEVVARA